jgi:uncharacterized repeat protein (TIGR01451 family)
LLAAFVLAAPAAQAAVIVNKTFSPASMTVGGTSTLTITLGNTGAAAATAAAFTDTFPSGLVVASPSNVATTCGGTATAVPGSGSVALSGGTIAAGGGSCTVTATVTASAIGNYTNTIPIGALTSSQGSNGSAASATLAVLALQPVTGTWAGAYQPPFGGRLKGNGGPDSLTLTLNNVNTIGLTNLMVPVTLAQPVLTLASPANMSTTCGGGTLTPTANGLTLSGGSIAASGNCTIKFDIIAAQPNTYFLANALVSVVAGTVTDSQGVTNTGAGINIATQTGVRIDKTFLPTSIISGGVSTVTLTLNNFNYSALSPINLTDTLPIGISNTNMVVAPVPNASTTCGGILTATPGAGSVQLAGGSLPAVPPAASASTTCTITFDIVGSTPRTVPTNLVNSIPAGNFASVGYPAAAATLTILPNQPLAGSTKVVSNQNYAGNEMGYAGSTHSVTITLNNTTTSPITVTSLADDLSTMGTGFVIAGDTPPSTTCAGGTVTAVPGNTTFTMAGGVIPPSNGTTPGNCTVTAGVYIPLATTSLGTHTNTIPIGGIVTDAGSNVTPITFPLSVYTPLAISKTFTPASVNAGGTSTLTVNIVNRQASTGEINGDPLTNITGADPLPAGMVVATPPAVTTTCNAGTNITAAAGGSNLSFSGVNLAFGQLCSITVNVTVPAGTPAGILTNTIPASSFTTDQGMTNSTTPSGTGGYSNGQAAANLTVTGANVTINKTFTPATVAVGTTSQLAINFINNNPGNIALSQVALVDALPIGMMVATPAGASFTGSGCSGTVAAAVGALSVGVSNAAINAGSSCTLKVNVVGTAAGNLINTIPAGALVSLQSVSNSAPATATLQATGAADLAITKSDGVTTVATGTATTYTVVVSNAGPNNVIGAVVADAQPSGMTFANWTCTATSGASCGAPSGSGAISDTININVGSTVTYSVTAQVAPNFAGTSITNTATVTPPGIVTDSNQGNNTASDIDTVVQGVVLALTKDDGSATYTPGGSATYTVTVKNTGGASATQLSVSDALPTGVTLSGAATCTPAGAATCGTVTGGAGQSSFGATNATIPSGAANALTFALPVSFASTMTTSPLLNTVTATDAASGATGSASDSDTANATANVSIVKAGPASVIPGAPISYTLTIRNAGPSAANGTTFNDALPATITGITASCGGATGGAVCPGSVSVAGNAVSGTIATMPPNSLVVVTINGTTSASANASISNTATVTPPGGTTDPATGNNTSTATTAIQPIVHITKTVDATTVVPGDTVHYTITVTNTGPVAANNTLVTDPLPNGIITQSWTCAAASGAVCPNASGNAAISETVATLPSGGSLVYTVTATVSLVPPTNINNTATATPQNGACAPANTPAPCSATASLPPVPQIGLSKTADTTTVTPGGTITYTVVVSNTGVVAADGTPVDDPIAAGIASQTWTCTGSAGAACTSTSGTGSISDVIATFPAGSFVTYTVIAIVDTTPPAIVSNTVTVTPTDPTTVCTPGNTPGPCVATANVTSNAQISIAKTADTSALTPGGNVTYTITVTNTGAAAADGTTLDDPLPAGIASQTWTCAANAGATCAPNGTGAISDTLTTFPPGSFVTYTITATIDANPPATITNIATANPPPGGICTPGNTPAPCDAETSGGAVPQISVTKTSDATGAVTPGGTVTYTLTATNAGSADAPNTLVSDTMPAGVVAANWTCAATGGAACPSLTGIGNVNETIATFPAGSSVVYTIVATVSATPPASITNTASVMPASGVCLPGNTAPPCTAAASNASASQITVTKTADDASYSGGGTLSWTLTITNSGSSSADGTSVSDALPAGIVSSSWTCVPGIGAVCANPNGTGAINETITTLPAGSSVTYLISGTVALPAPTSITNTAAANPPAGGTCGAGNTAPPCTATAVTASAPSVAIAKSVADANANGIADPGEPLTYTIVLTNAGGTAATGFGVSDPIDANTTFVSADNGGTFAGGIVTWSGLGIPAGGNLVLHVVTAVRSPLAAGIAQIANVAYETGTTPPSCPPSGPQCAVLPTPGSVTLTKSVIDANGNGIAEAGESLSYTIVLTNSGGSDVSGYDVTDPLDPNLVFDSADNGGAEAGGIVSWNGLVVPAGDSLTLSVVAAVAEPLASGVAQIANVAYQTGTTAPACPGPSAQCVVLPTPGTVTITKTVADASGNGVAEPGEQLTYTIVLANAGGSAVSNIDITDPLDANVAFVSASNGGVSAGGVVNWSGLSVPSGGNVSLTVVVNVASPLASGTATISNVAYLAGDTPPDCTLSPRPANCSLISTAPAISIAKSAGTPTPNGTPNQFTLTYTATVSNSGGSVGHYDLADTLAFNGATVTAISAPLYASSTGDTRTGTLGSFVAPSGGTIVSNEDLGAGGRETWTYTVTYTIDDGSVASDCNDPLNGLRNSAVLGGAAAGAPPAQTCTGTASVSIQKSASAPVPTSTPNEFTLTYTVNVSNTGTLPGSYDLSDVLTFNGATIGAIGAPVYSSSSGDPQDGVLGAFGPPDGGVIVTGESISAGGVQTWVYTVTYKIDDAPVAEDCTTPSGGLRNSAALAGSVSGQSATCTGAAAVVIGKTASGPVPTANPGEYALTYLVTVQNNGSLSGMYDLDDAFTFPGVSAVSVSAVQHGGSDPLGTPLGTLTATGGNIVTGESIAAGLNETYTYVVTFTIDDAVAVGSCALGGGLVNNAALGGSSSGQVSTCTDVPSVTIAKSASAPTPTGTPNQYAIAYTVTIDNVGAAAGSYDLADAFAFAGATIDTVSTVTHAGPDPLSTTLGTLTNGGGTIVTAETIAGGSSESYSYTVAFTVTDSAAANDCTTPTGGLRNAASLGGSASGDADTCTGAPSVTLAKVLSNESGTQPGIAEPGETLTYTITLSNSGATAATAYGVTDPLDPNVTFVSASNGGTAAAGVVTWSNLTVPANGTLALTVAVTVNAPIPAGVAAIGNLAYATGSTPPDCTTSPTPSACVITPTPTPTAGVVSITKTVADANGNGLAEPGETLTYTITLSNTSGGDAVNYGVTDPLDANVAFVSASNGGTFAGGTVTWSALTIPAGQSVALTVVVTVNTPLPANVTQIGNLAYQTGGAPPDCTLQPRPANCAVSPVPAAGAVTLVKTVADANGNGLADPGETLNYTITLTNSGGQDVSGYGVIDPLDANVVFVSASNGGAFAGGAVTWTNLTVPANGSVTLTVATAVVNPIPSGVTSIANVVYATGSTPTDCSAAPMPPSCAVIATAPVAGVAQLQISKHANAGTVTPGGTLVYTVAVGNVGTAAATSVVISDPIPAGIASYAWTCAASGSASCANSSGSGAVDEMIASIPPGGALTYTVTAVLSANPPSSIVNVANVTSPAASVCAPSGSAPPCTSQAVVAVFPGGGPSAAVPTPVDSRWMLLAMAMLLMGAAALRGRRRI